MGEARRLGGRARDREDRRAPDCRRSHGLRSGAHRLTFTQLSAGDADPMRRAPFILLAAVLLSGCGSHAPEAQRTSITVQSVSNASAESLQAAFERVVRTVSPEVVQIQTAEGLGSGIVFDGKGDVVTNAHVVGTAKNVTVTDSTGKSR